MRHRKCSPGSDSRSAAQAEQYRGRILAAVPEGSSFQPLMTLYLTDKTPPEEVSTHYPISLPMPLPLCEFSAGGVASDTDIGRTIVFLILINFCR